MELKEWVRAARKHRNWTQEKLGEAVGRSKANVALWESGKHSPSYSQVVEIARHTGFPTPDNLGDDAGALEMDYSLSGEGNIVGIPVTGDIRFVNGVYTIEEASEGGYVLGSGVHEGYCLRVQGDELRPTLKDGDLLVLDPHANPAFSEYCLLRTPSGDWFVEFLADKDESKAFEVIQTGERLTIREEDIDQLDIVVATVSRRQWRKTWSPLPPKVKQD